MDESHFEVREVEARDLEALGALHKKCYGRAADMNALQRRMSAWTHTFNAIGYVAIKAGGAIVSSYTVFPTNIRVRGVDLRAAQSGDTMTDPEFAGQGLFTKLAKLTYERCKALGIIAVFGFPNRNSAPGFARKLGWRMQGRIGVLTVPAPYYLRREERSYNLQMALGAECHTAGIAGGITYSKEVVENKVRQRGVVRTYRGVSFAVVVDEFVHLCVFDRTFSLPWVVILAWCYGLALRTRARGLRLQSYSRADWFWGISRKTGYIGALYLGNDSSLSGIVDGIEYCFFDHDVF